MVCGGPSRHRRRRKCSRTTDDGRPDDAKKDDLEQGAQLEPAADVVERLERMRDELIFAYDTETHHLAKLIEALVECEEGEELHRLHERAVLPTQPPLCLTLQHAFKLAGRKLPKQWLAVMGARRNKGVLRKMLASPAYLEWLQGYDEWVHAVVLPIIGEPFYSNRQQHGSRAQRV